MKNTFNVLIVSMRKELPIMKLSIKTSQSKVQSEKQTNKQKTMQRA